MKLPNTEHLAALAKAPVNDPIIAGITSTSPNTSNGHNASITSKAGISDGSPNDGIRDNERIASSTPSADITSSKPNDSTKPNASITGALSKVTIRIPADLAARARTAFHMEAASGSIGSFSEWVGNAIAHAIKESARNYNGGIAYQPTVENLPAGRVPRRN